MEIKILAKEKDSLEVELKGADETILYPLVTQLLADENVAEAKYTLEQQGVQIPRLFIRMKDGKPQTSLKKAIKTIVTELGQAEKLFDKALK